MSAQHTPGPWSIVKYTNYDGFSIQSLAQPSYGCIAERWESGLAGESREANRLANARLIAAAPDLLEALEIMISDFGDYPASERPCRAFDLAYAAIAKAKGEQP